MFSFLTTIFAGSFFRDAEGVLKSGWQWLFSSATHILVALLALVLLFGLWERHEYHKTQTALASCVAGRKADLAQWNAQVLAAQAATAQAKQKGKDTANASETFHTQLQSDTGHLLDYVAAHRVQPQSSRPSAAPGASSGDNPPLHADTPALPAVAVPASVLNTCDADYTYAASAYQLGQSLIHQGLAIPQP